MTETLSQRNKNLLTGRLSRDDMPSGSANMVRIYICSAGTDSVTERDAFVEVVYPRLREYCRNKTGLEFQVVDLNWGLPPGSLDDLDDMGAVRIREIQKCLHLSAGPNFIAFIGQKYGPRTLPAEIPQEDFDILRLALHAHKGRDTRTAPLLDHCYQLDENNIPPVYVLKARLILVPQLSDNNEEARHTARTKWEELQCELIRLIHKGAELACLDNSMDRETAERYTLPDLVNQILLGIETNERPDERCVLITRNIQDLKNYTHDLMSQNFADIAFNAKRELYHLDEEAAQLLVKLRNRVVGLVSPNNTIHHDVLWRYETVIHPKLHFDYLQSLCEKLYSTCARLVDERVHKPENDLPRACEESKQHWSRCRELSLRVNSHSPVLGRLHEYVKSSQTTPLIVFGGSGCGKSTIISKLAIEIQDTLSDDDMVVLRYIGDVTDSVDLRQILISLCTQIAMATGKPLQQIPFDVKELVKLFSELMTSVPANKGLVIILDGVEQLSPDHAAFTLNWTPLVLPPNVKLIITVHNNAQGLLDHIKHELLPDSPQSFLEVMPINVDECEELLVGTLAAMNRCLTSEQRLAFRNVMEREPTPLFVELLVNIAKDVNSLTSVESLRLPYSSDDAITKLFDKLETKHGHMLVFRAFAYMVASLTGLSDCEMEDLLSLDEDVLNDIYQDYHPPLRRVPCIKWLAVKQDVELFLTCKETDGVTVTAWKHDTFNDAVNRRYLSDASVITLVHSNMADYFLGTWSGRSKPATISESINESNRCFNTDRKVPSQPHTYEGQTTKFNKRMYQQVPRHLDLAGRYKELDSLVLFNYEWLYNKTKALSLHHVVADLSLNPGEEVNLVKEVLKLSESAIEQDFNNLPTEISGHLLPYYTIHSNIRSLIRQCDTIGLKHCALVPNFPYHHVPGGSLQCTLTCPTEMEHFLLVHGDRYLVCKKRDDTYVHTFDLIKGEHTSSVLTSVGELYTTPNGKFLIIVDHVTEKAIKIHDVETGAFLKQIIIMNHIEGKSSLYKKGPLSITDDRLCAVVTLTNSVLCICDIPSGNVLSIIPLEGKSCLCVMTPDGSRVFVNSNDLLLTFDVYTQAHLLTVPVGSKPSTLTFTQDGLRLFLSNDTDAKVTVMHLSGDVIDLTYRLDFDEKMPGDSIKDLKVSPDDSMLLIRGNKTLVVQHRGLEEVIAVFSEPDDAFSESRLFRANYVDHHFIQAEFNRDNSCIIAAIFRSVYVWRICDGSVISIIQGHLGQVRSMLVSRSVDQVVTHRNKSKDIQIWNISEGVRKVASPDKLTAAVTEFQLTSDNSLLFVKCRQSHDLGVIDMRHGCLVHVLTHDTDVQDFAVSPDGKWALVSTSARLNGTAFKLWNNEERRVVLERGDVAGYCVGTNILSCIIMVAQKDKSFRSPYFIAVIHFNSQEYHEQAYPESFVHTVRSKPFVTYTDEYLIINSALNFDTGCESYSHPCLHIFQVKNGTHARTWDASSMNFQQHLLDILEVRPCRQQNGNLVAAIFSCRDNHQDASSLKTCNISNEKTGNTFGFFLLDASTGSLTLLCIPFPKPSYGSNAYPLILTPDCSMCIDEMSYIFNIPSEEFIGQVSNLIQPRAFALQGTVVVYYSRTMLQVIRISDGASMASCLVSSPICQLLVCSDERTVLVGCEDGAVLCYTIIDATTESVAPILDSMPSRAVGDPELLDDPLIRSGVKMEQVSCSRSSTVTSSLSSGKLSQPADQVGAP